MRLHDSPASPSNPYPPAPIRVAGFRYLCALWLTRAKDAVVTRTGEDADYIVARPYDVQWRTPAGDWRQITVPAGLITDLTSVPVLLRGLVGRVGPWLEAAIVHDYLYIAWQDVPGMQPTEADRRFADAIMLAAMKAAGVGWLARRIIHLGVRLGGGCAFRRMSENRYVDPTDLTDCDPWLNRGGAV